MVDQVQSLVRLNQLIDQLVDVKNLGNRLDENLTKQTNNILGWLDVDKKVSRDNVEEIIGIFRQVISNNPEITIEQIEDNFLNQKGRDEFESVALDQSRLEILLDELDKSQNLKAEDLSKHPVFLGVRRDEIQKIIEQKIKLQAEAVNRGESKKMADLESDLQLMTEAKLVEAGVEADKAEKVAISAAAIAVKSTSLDDASKRIAEVLIDEKIDRGIGREVIEATVNKTAEVAVTIKTEEIVDKFVEDIKKVDIYIDLKAETKIREEVRKRVEEEIENSLPRVAENKTIKTEDRTKPRLSNLTEETIKAVGIDIKREEIKRIVESAQLETDGFIKDNNEIVGRFREKQLEKEIAAELIVKGEDVKIAFKSAKTWGNFAYPEGKAGQLVDVDEKAIAVALANGYEGDQLKEASYRARFLTRLVMSPKSVEENLVDLTQYGNIENNEQISEWQQTANKIARNKEAIRSLEYIRGAINFQKRLDNIAGGTALRLGNIIHSKKLENWGLKIANRIDTIEWGNIEGTMATYLGEAQINGGSIIGAVRRISDDWLGGRFNPLNIGSTLNKIGGPRLAEFGNNLLSSGQILGKKTGLNALSALKAMGTKLFPKAMASLGKMAMGLTGPIGALLAVASFIDLKEVFRLVAMVVGGLFIGLLVVIPLLTLGPISSLMPTTGAGLGQEINVGHVDKYGNPIVVSGQAAPGLPVGFLSGAEYDVSSLAIADTYKQCAGSWSTTPLPGSLNGGTVCSSGCGPSSVSMVISRINGACTPDKMYTDLSCGAECFVGSGRGGTGVMQNFCALNKFLPGKVSVTTCSSATEIANFIKGGNLVMVLADFYYNATSTGGHYFLATGVKNGQIVVKDPYFPKANPFDGKAEFGSIYKVYNCILIKG